MKLAFILICTAALCGAATFEQHARIIYESDSLSFSRGRMEHSWYGVIYDDWWQLSVADSYLSSDSGGVVQRRILEGNDLLVDARIEGGPVWISPELRWNTFGSTDSVLFGGTPATTISRDGLIRPGLELGAALPADLLIALDGRYWGRGTATVDGEDAGWTSRRLGGEIVWTSPLGLMFSGGGTSCTHTADLDDYEQDWTRIDLSVMSRPLTIPTRTQLMADADVSLYQGRDYLDRELADRIKLRIRAVQSVHPSISFNMTIAGVVDHSPCQDWVQSGQSVTLDEEWRLAAGAGTARLVYFFDRSGEVPSSLTFGGRITSSSIETTMFDMLTRVNVYKGLSILLDGEFRKTPTSVIGADPDRRSVTLGTGLEYQLARNLIAWAGIEQYRTELAEVEAWSRVHCGIEAYPGVISF